MKVKYEKHVGSVVQIPPEERARLEEVARRYAFRVNDYYLGLIDWSDPADPIRRLVIPDVRELEPWGRLDASNERAYTVARGVQHKYPRTVLLLVNEICGAYCRYCFRKRLFMDGNDEASLDVSEGIDYIRAHPEVTNVLLTGGDPLLLGTRRILEIVETVRAIPHVGIIRIGSKMPAFDPWRILDDPELVEGLSRNSTREKRVYLMAHFDHPRELTEPALESLDTLIRAGVICVNQCPIIRGINDSADVLETLFRRLSLAGVPPYYLFQGRPTEGNEPYEVPIVEGYFAFEEAKKRVSGLARRARFCMSHESGKIEIVGVDGDRMYLRYHRARDSRDEGRLMIFRRDDAAFWLDGLTPADGCLPPTWESSGFPEMAAGPE